MIGALGASAAGVAFLLGPYLTGATGRPSLPVIELVMPTTDVLLLALLVAVGSILGARLDRTPVPGRCRHVLRPRRRRRPVQPHRCRHVRRRQSAGAHLAHRDLPGRPGGAPCPTAAAPGPRAALPRRMAAARDPAGLQRGQPRRAGRGLGRRHAGRGRLAGDRLRARRHHPDGRHLPRGSFLQRDPAAGPHRRTQRPAEPSGAARRSPADARRRDGRPAGRAAPAGPGRLQGGQRQPGPPRRRPPAPPDRPAAAPRPAVRRPAGPAGRRRVRRPAARCRPRRGGAAWPTGCANWCCSRSPSKASGCTSGSASAWPAHPFRPPRWRNCSAAPTSPCTPPRRAARASTSTCPTRTAGPATGCGAWRTSARRSRSTTSSRCTSSRRSASATAGWSARRRWCAGSTRPWASSPPPSCCRPPSRQACCVPSRTRCWNCR